MAEVVTCLYKAKRRNYLNITQFENLYDKSYELMNMMIAFRNKIN
ncbi:four helix bundle protein [Gelidibacter sp. F63206]|nr:four helix bundle protein [Gelidibacter sp. F63206]MCK0114410.1 four helix bundle protein [Gelidibacter sp. F63206]